jgi:hypothetical protein
VSESAHTFITSPLLGGTELEQPTYVDKSKKCYSILKMFLLFVATMLHSSICRIVKKLNIFTDPQFWLFAAQQHGKRELAAQQQVSSWKREEKGPQSIMPQNFNICSILSQLYD